MTTRGAARTTGAVAAALVLGGCGFHGIYSLPLPGAAGNGKPSYTVTVQFRDALDLVPYSTVKVNDATVGHVTSVHLVHGLASVACAVPKTVRLPANAVASIGQTSLLGEKFVELEAPARGATGRLRGGAVIPVSRTDTSATVEEVLGALSLLLNGGGLNQIHTIATELNDALSGREGTARDVLQQISRLAAGLDAQRADIVRAMQGIDRLSATVHAQESTLTGALDAMPQAIKLLADNRSQLTTMLVSLQHLGDVAVRVEKNSQADLVANLHDLQPTLQQLSEAGDSISKSLEALFTFPVASGSYRDVYQGDYTNIGLTIDLRASSLLHNFGLDGTGPTGTSGGGTSGGGGLQLPGLPGLRLPLPGRSGAAPSPGGSATASPSSPSSPSAAPSAPSARPSTPALPTLPRLPLGPAAAGSARPVPAGGTRSDIATLLLGVLR